MKYDYLNGESSDDYEEFKFFTIGELIDLCRNHKTCKFRFANVHATVGDLGSWRGSYGIPSITPEWNTEFQTGEVISDRLNKQTHEKHFGYKGGEYRYDFGDEFYVSSYGSAQEYKIIGYELKDGIVTLLTKLDPY